jgi:hypothetical protein
MADRFVLEAIRIVVVPAPRGFPGLRHTKQRRSSSGTAAGATGPTISPSGGSHVTHTRRHSLPVPRANPGPHKRMSEEWGNPSAPRCLYYSDSISDDAQPGKVTCRRPCSSRTASDCVGVVVYAARKTRPHRQAVMGSRNSRSRWTLDAFDGKRVFKGGLTIIGLGRPLRA